MNIKLRSVDEIEDYADVVCIVKEWIENKAYLADARIAELLDRLEAYEVDRVIQVINR